MPNNEPTEKTMQLTDRYFLNRDRFNMWITEKYDTKDKKGNPIKAYRNLTGYHSNFHTMVRAFIQTRARNVEAQTVKELIQQMEEIQTETEELISKLNNCHLQDLV